MDGARLSTETIQGIVDLHRKGHSSKEITRLKGLKVRTVQDWILKFKRGGGAETPTPKKPPGGKKKVSEKTRHVLKRQLEANPSLTARKLKEQNSMLLENVSLRCVQDTLWRDLGFKSYRALRKPLIDAPQMKNRISFAKEHKELSLEQWRKVL